MCVCHVHSRIVRNPKILILEIYTPNWKSWLDVRLEFGDEISENIWFHIET